MMPLTITRLFSPARFAAVSCAAALFAVASASFAQETPPPAPTPPPAAPAAPNTDQAKAAFEKAVEAMNKARIMMNKDLGIDGPLIRGFAMGSQFAPRPRLPQKTISLNLKNVPAREAVEKILSEAKLDYVIDDDFSKESRVSLSVSDVQISTALDLVTQSAGVQWAAERRDNKTIVRVGKKVAGNSFSDLFNYSYFPNTVTGTVRGMPVPDLRWNNFALPSTKVSLDLRDASAQDALKKLLEKQNLTCEFASDFPQNAKITLLIEDAELSTVLDRIAASVGVRWVAEKRGDKTVVRFGKTVVPNSFYYQYGGKDDKSGSVLPTPADGQKVNTIRIDQSSAGTPVVYQYQTSEQRSTFTCPHCGKKTTIVEKNGAVKPGAKTADAHGGWHYCPYCGKKVSLQNAHFAAPLWDDMQNAPAESEPFLLPTLPLSPPVYDTSLAPPAKD